MRPRRYAAVAWELRATSRTPRFPSSDSVMVAARAMRPWLVQMFEVALARRMCCSRVESVST